MTSTVLVLQITSRLRFTDLTDLTSMVDLKQLEEHENWDTTLVTRIIVVERRIMRSHFLGK